MGAAMRCTTGCCCTPTVIAKFTVGGCRWNQPRLARGVCEGPSRMQGNLPVRFRGEEVRATSPPYPTSTDKCAVPLSVPSARDRYILVQAIEEQLTHQPTIPTRNRKRLRENPWA